MCSCQLLGVGCERGRAKAHSDESESKLGCLPANLVVAMDDKLPKWVSYTKREAKT